MARTWVTSSAIVGLSLSLVVAGCATQGQSVGGGALAGAILGAALGGRNSTRNAILGAMIGATAGYLIYQSKSRQLQTASQARRRYHYSPSEGFQMRLDGGSVMPQQVNRGGAVTARMEYATLGTRGGAVVQQTRVLKKDGRVVARLQRDHVRRSDGTWENSLAFKVPKNAPSGMYTVSQEIQSQGQMLVTNSYFSVTNQVGAADSKKGLEAMKVAFLRAH